MSRRSSLSSDVAYLAHVVEVPTSADDSRSHQLASASASARARWYPLHQLARWSGTVPATAAPPVVKRAMAEARAAIEARTEASGRGGGRLEDAYRKIGQTVCVSEAGFGWSVRAWLMLHPENAALQQFGATLPRIQQAVFHAPLPVAATATAAAAAQGAAAVLPVDLVTLRAKYAFDASVVQGDEEEASVASASLAAPPTLFSLAAFLDQHLQTHETRPVSMSPTTEEQEEDSAGVVRSELAQLQHSLLQERSEFSRTHPALVATEQNRLQFAQSQLASLAAQHSSIQARLHSHLHSSAPLHMAVQKLQSNMAFIQHVQSYETLLRQVTELSERCRDTLSASGAPATGAEGKESHASGTALSSSSLDAHNVASICTAFLKLLRIYHGLHEITQRTRASNDTEAEQKQASSISRSSTSTSAEKKYPDDERQHGHTNGHGGHVPNRSWSGVLHLERMVRQRILTILRPLQGKLIALFQQTLLALNWPQTSTSLLLGLHTMPAPSISSPPLLSPTALLSPHSASAAAVGLSALSGGSASALELSLALFDTLTENLVRMQMLLAECGMEGEIRRIEREIDATKQQGAVALAEAPAEPPRLWVLSLLLQPIYRRFYFHFDSPASAVVMLPDASSDSDTPAAAASSASSSSSSSLSAASLPAAPPTVAASQTNRLDKPEWVCTFLEKCLTDHREFLVQRVQPIVNRCHLQGTGSGTGAGAGSGSGSHGSHPTYDFTTEFLEALLRMYFAKLARPSTQSALLAHPPLLQHTLDELVSFETKLQTHYGYPINSSRRISLMDAFLRTRAGREALVKAERERVNKGLDKLRNQPDPWALVLRKHRGGGGGGRGTRGGAGNDSSDEDEEDVGVDGISAADADESFDPAASSSASDALLSSPSASSATHSSLSLLSLVASLSSRMRSIKFLNVRLSLLKDILFKLFEIYEEDVMRSYQDNWTRVMDNARRGGLKYLRMERKGANMEAHTGSKARTPSSKQNPLALWQTHCGLLNSLSYIGAVLQGWNDDLLFLELFYYYTHRTRIQSSFLEAHHRAAAAAAQQQAATAAAASTAAAGDGSAAAAADHLPPPAGVLVRHGDEEEVLITSEELALWMVQGGNVSHSSVPENVAPPAALAPAADAQATASNASAPGAASSGAPTPQSFLPEGFDRTVDLLRVLDSFSSSTASNGPFGASSSSSSDSLIPKSSAADLRASPSRSTASASVLPPSLPLDLSLSLHGTLFEPIQVSFRSLAQEMMSVLVALVAGHFRDAMRASGYVARGFMESVHAATSHGDAFNHPDLRAFLAHAHRVSESQGVAPAQVADWSLLEHHVELSLSLGQPLLDLKMQLIVVHHALTRELHRVFWTSVAAKLQHILFEELVEGKYFSRRGGLTFMRDMRALFVLFALYQPTSSAPTAAGAALNTHFKLVQDAINLLLLSPAQRASLRSQLTSGTLASSSSAAMRTFLAKPPYALQKMTASQVLDMLARVREEEEEEGEEEVEEEEEELKGALEPEQGQEQEAPAYEEPEEEVAEEEDVYEQEEEAFDAEEEEYGSEDASGHVGASDEEAMAQVDPELHLGEDDAGGEEVDAEDADAAPHPFEADESHEPHAHPSERADDTSDEQEQQQQEYESEEDEDNLVDPADEAAAADDALRRMAARAAASQAEHAAAIDAAATPAASSSAASAAPASLPSSFRSPISAASDSLSGAPAPPIQAAPQAADLDAEAEGEELNLDDFGGFPSDDDEEAETSHVPV